MIFPYDRLGKALDGVESQRLGVLRGSAYGLYLIGGSRTYPLGITSYAGMIWVSHSMEPSEYTLGCSVITSRFQDLAHVYSVFRKATPDRCFRFLSSSDSNSDSKPISS